MTFWDTIPNISIERELEKICAQHDVLELFRAFFWQGIYVFFSRYSHSITGSPLAYLTAPWATACHKTEDGIDPVLRERNSQLYVYDKDRWIQMFVNLFSRISRLIKGENSCNKNFTAALKNQKFALAKHTRFHVFRVTWLQSSMADIFIFKTYVVKTAGWTV